LSWKPANVTSLGIKYTNNKKKQPREQNPKKALMFLSPGSFTLRWLKVLTCGGVLENKLAQFPKEEAKNKNHKKEKQKKISLACAWHSFNNTRQTTSARSIV
jgi:hypothetical protein